MRAAMIVGMALMLAGCGHLPFGHRPPRGGETITYERRVVPTIARPGWSGYVVTLGPDGQGILTVGRGAAAVDRRFQASGDQVAAFAAALRRVRPGGERMIPSPGHPCRTGLTDQDIVDVRWQDADGRVDHLSLDEGCDARSHRKEVAALRSAPSLLPIADLIGPH